MTPEGQIKKDICDYLSAIGVMFWIQQAGKIPGRINRSRYLRNGVSDLLGLWKGRLLAIEVKTPKGRVSPEQQSFIDEVNRFGGKAFIARSLDDVIRELKPDKT